MKRLFLILFLFPVFSIFLILPKLFAEPLYSSAWGFSLDLPEGYELSSGNGKDRFSFSGPGGARFDLAVYPGTYKTIQDMAADVNRRLKNQGEASFFEYQDKHAVLIELQFADSAGWGLGVEMSAPNSGATGGSQFTPKLLALSYGPAGKGDLELFLLSALDSIAPTEAERRCPGPVTEFDYPRGELKRTGLALPEMTALIRENDAEAAQSLIDREFAVLRFYEKSENWQEAWVRFYRAIYRDSWDRLTDAVFQLEREWNVSAGTPLNNGPAAPASDPDRTLAEKALSFVQSFNYERDLMGSDFVNLVSAVTEGRGDCDSRAMLWAMILAQADIPAAIMVSRDHSHAMGLAGVTGTGARFEANGIKWLVAETTAPVNIGLIDQTMSDIGSWLGVIFE